MATTQPDGFLALPEGGKGSGVLVLHAWWGLNDTIKEICMRLAQEGFVVFAPDLYHGKIAKTIPEAEALAGALDANYYQALTESAEAARFLIERTGGETAGESGGVAVIGFSLGAFYGLTLANAHPELVHSVVLFYGAGGEDFSNSRAAYLGHFAEDDPYEPPSNVNGLEEAIRAAGRPVTFYRYPKVGHWFFEPDITDHYNAEAAALAWERTLAFLRRAS